MEILNNLGIYALVAITSLSVIYLIVRVNMISQEVAMLNTLNANSVTNATVDTLTNNQTDVA